MSSMRRVVNTEPQANGAPYRAAWSGHSWHFRDVRTPVCASLSRNNQQRSDGRKGGPLCATHLLHRDLCRVTLVLSDRSL